jgi:hypothetical protein
MAEQTHTLRIWQDCLLIAGCFPGQLQTLLLTPGFVTI